MARYYIHRRHHFYTGTIGAPLSGPYCAFGERVEFNTRAEAICFAKTYLGMHANPWRLRHGEYAAPEITIRKVRASTTPRVPDDGIVR